MRAAGALAVGLALIAPASAEAAGWSRAATLSPRGSRARHARGGGQRGRRGRRRLGRRRHRLAARRCARRWCAGGGSASRGRSGAGTTSSRRSAPTAPPPLHGPGAATRSRSRCGGPAGASARRASSRGYGAEPRVAVAASGEVAVTWVDRHRDFTRAMAAFGTADGFGAPVPLDTASFAYPVELAFDGSGRPRDGVVGPVGAGERADVDLQGHPPRAGRQPGRGAGGGLRLRRGRASGALGGGRHAICRGSATAGRRAARSGRRRPRSRPRAAASTRRPRRSRRTRARSARGSRRWATRC